MPSPSTPSRTPKRRENSSTPPKTKPVDVGEPLGVYDTNSVRDRIRHWQAQGGGVVTESDFCMSEGDEEHVACKQRTPKKEDVSKTPKSKDLLHEDRGTGTSGKRDGRRKTKAEEEEPSSHRSVSAPAKRVVSDGHWRRDRTPRKSTTPSRLTKDDKLKKTLTKTPAGDGIRVKAIPEIKSEPRPRNNGDRRAQRETAESHDGIRVYSTPPGSRGPSRHGQSLQSDDSGSRHGVNCDAEAASSRSKSPRPLDSAKRPKRHSPEKLPRANPPAGKEGPDRRKAAPEKERVPSGSPSYAQGGFSEGRGSARSHKGNILSQVFGDSRKVFTKAQPVPIAAPRVPSIEAWLNETPDPFVDVNEPPMEAIAPLRPSSRVKEEVPEGIHAVEDPNKIWEALEPKSSPRSGVHGSRRRKRVPSSTIYEGNPFPPSFDSGSALGGSPNGTISASKFVDIVRDAPELSPSVSPSSLRRRGANRSSASPTRDRQKSRSSKGPLAEDDGISTLSSNITTSSVEAPDPRTPLRPPGLNLKRPFPSTGRHRLSTIASVETFNTKSGAAPPSISEVSEATVEPEPVPEGDDEAEARDHFDPNSLQRSRSRLTKHADLMSVLSLPKAGNKSIASARSIRTNRSRLATATIGDLMNELASDETKYMRELRTLVDGVIPVLLTCVLSKSDSSIAAGLFHPSASTNHDPNFTKPIVDMGIALERLKTLHKRIPQQDASALLTWAQGAQRVYTEYLKAWRMGFQDVVVNLAPAKENKAETSSQGGASDLDEGLPRNNDGDVVNGDGERVDVAFLLKRPLVRLKYLAKTLKGINFVTPSAEAESLATKYQNLVADARNRSNEERARLEDEAASNIDPTRARDPRSLAPLTGVTVDRTRRVRARDHFNLALQHSSGQRIDCRVELLLRDEATKTETGGDLLICEVDGTGRWLLFPPVQYARVSARNGDSKGEIAIMVRGFASNGLEWHELLSLQSEEEEAGFEWVQMLGLIPVPPKIPKFQSFVSGHRKSQSFSDQASSTLETPVTPTMPGKSRTPSPREVEIPIGEQPYGASKPWTEVSCSDEPYTSPMVTQLRDRARLQKKQQQPLPSTPSKPSPNYVDDVSDLRSLPSQSSSRQKEPPEVLQRPRSFKEALGLAGTSSVTVGLQRSKAKRRSRYEDQSPLSPKSPRSKERDGGAITSDTDRMDNRPKEASPSPTDQRSLFPEPALNSSLSSRKSDPATKNGEVRPAHHRSRSSVPSLELPFISKARKNSPPTTPTYEPASEPDWGPVKESEQSQPSPKLVKKRPVSRNAKAEKTTPPSTPPHKSPSPVQLKGSKTPVLEAGKIITPRRSSSPLKHEYEPSTASDSSSDSETSTVEHNEATSITDSSEDEELEDGDAPTPLLPLGAIPTFKKATPPGSIYSIPNGTLAPSQSASQAPYKTVPPQPTKAAKTIASIFSWSDNGSWDALHADECSIVITPGLIEAYEMSAAHSKNLPLSSSTPVGDPDTFSDLASNVTPEDDNNQYGRPLVALELTPLVPLRRGTAIDISIRSPPTANSQITSGNNIMFRSRNPEECEALYALINHSRINNPTYVALQNARATGNPFPSHLDRRSSTRPTSRSSSWFPSLGRSSSYRASSAPTPSIAPSESSIGSMSSAFSALKRFGLGSGGGMFNIGRSTISSREGSRANSIYTGSENSSGSGASSPLPPGSISDPNGGNAAPIGLSNAKIRLYIRETASRWRDMGSARLTIMRSTAAVAEALLPRPHPRNDEKRIVVNGKTKGEVLLDATLGESCFERVARTGIAISVWEDVKGPNGEVGVVNAVGGVGGGRAVVYMVQVCFLSVTDSVRGCTVANDDHTDEKRSRDCLYFLYSGEAEILIARQW